MTGAPAPSEITINPTRPFWRPGLDAARACRRCGARTRKGTPCRGAAVAGRKRCRMHGGSDGSGAPRGRGNGRYKFGRHTETARRWRAGLRTLQAQAAIIPRLPSERQDAALVRLCDAATSTMDRQGEYLPELAQLRSVMRLMTQIEAIGAKRKAAHASSGDALGAILARLAD